MNWPTHTDYQDAIQNPVVCFQEPELKEGAAAQDMLGLPRVMSGNFASVYELNRNGQRWAVRCFVRQVMGQQGRYARLSQYLSALTMPWLVKFEYMLKGILVRGEWYPIVKMDWVEGLPLNMFMDEHVNEKETMETLAAQFRKMCLELNQHQIAHGDFQHGNIMVTTAGELRLVDYDGMYCPAFGKGRSPELGHANFQHPGRTPEFYEESLDNFSALIIYTSLLALAADPGLWKEFYTGDNLLFSVSDYKNVHASKLFARLENSPNANVQTLSSLIKQLCLGPIALVPSLESALTDLDNGVLAAKILALPASQKPAESEGGGWWEDSEMEPPMGSRTTSRGSPNVNSPYPQGTRGAEANQTSSRSAWDAAPIASNTMSSFATGQVQKTGSAPAPSGPSSPAVSRPSPPPQAPARGPAADSSPLYAERGRDESEAGNSRRALFIGIGIGVIAVLGAILLFGNGSQPAPAQAAPPAAVTP